MKKIFYILCMVICLCVEGCGNMHLEALNKLNGKEQAAIKETTQKLIRAIEVRDKESIKELFSQNTIDDTKDIDSKIEDLLKYIDSDSVEIDDDDASNISDTSIEDGIQITSSYYKFKIKTNDSTYLMKIEQKISNKDLDNGICSLSIIREDEDIIDCEIQRGDETGLSIGKDIKWVKEDFVVIDSIRDDLKSIINKRNSSDVEFLFQKKTVKEEDILQLFEYIDSDVESIELYNDSYRMMVEDPSSGEDIRNIFYTLIVRTKNNSYQFDILEIMNDDENHEKIHSLRVQKIENNKEIVSIKMKDNIEGIIIESVR